LGRIFAFFNKLPVMYGGGMYVPDNIRHFEKPKIRHIKNIWKAPH